jgi:hypothetical protein
MPHMQKIKIFCYFKFKFNNYRRTEMKTLKALIIITLSIFYSIIFTNCSEKLKDGGLSIGWAMEDITPGDSAVLYGQYYDRISEYVQSPLTVTACAIESADNNGNKEQAIMLSADLLWVTKTMQDSLKNLIRNKIPDFDVQKLFVNTTHTHSAPNPDNSGAYGRFVLEKACKAAQAAWNNRKPAGISRGLGYAVVGHNRRVQYANGTTEMYGSTERDDFIGMEGASDSGIGLIFCFDLNKKLTGIIMNVSCPAQVTEAKYYVSADYWSEVRKQLRNKFSNNIYVLAQCGASGDQSPRDLPRGYKSGEPNMWDIPGIEEIGRRLIQAINSVYPDAKNSVETNPIFKHVVKNIDLPIRKVSEDEYTKAHKIVTEIQSREPKDINSPYTAWNRFLKEMKDNEKTNEYGPWDNKESDFGILKINEVLLKNYAGQNKNPFYRAEIHAIRLGDVAFASDPFELYVDYGFRIMGRSKAKQTFIIQLSCDYGDYLPTTRAISGGQYSALVSKVGPIGGQILVEESVKLINDMWK